MLRVSLRCIVRQDGDKIARVHKPVCTATEEAALDRFVEFADAWGRKYPAIMRLWENTRGEFTPFLRFDTELRGIVFTTNAIESVNARIPRAVKARGHFPFSVLAMCPPSPFPPRRAERRVRRDRRRPDPGHHPSPAAALGGPPPQGPRRCLEQGARPSRRRRRCPSATPGTSRSPGERVGRRPAPGR
nr:transposase [Streptomyces europaeiscabiei]